MNAEWPHFDTWILVKGSLSQIFTKNGINLVLASTGKNNHSGQLNSIHKWKFEFSQEHIGTRGGL